MPFIGQTRTFGGKDYIFTDKGWELQGGYQGPGVGPGPWAPDQPEVDPWTGPTEPGQITPPDPNNYWSKPSSVPGGDPDKAKPGEAGAWFEREAYDNAVARYQQLSGTEPGGPGGARGPTPEQLAIERSKVATANMANYIDAAARGLGAEIDARRLTTEQAIGEFNRQLDAMTEARTGFLGAQQWTVPEGAKTIHGDIRGALGMEEWIPDPIEYDPFDIALGIVEGTPELTSIGVPDMDALDRALELAEQFL
ncbi:hypothetical protein LCGC14_1622130 [marine sediment metagenome]|uniref:Uncharacterized protein n=1 Tax=marine sediment metagenome TaxID=412755 RepID=A0A0F9KKQ8_9ZZZZ